MRAPLWAKTSGPFRFITKNRPRFCVSIDTRKNNDRLAITIWKQNQLSYI